MKIIQDQQLLDQYLKQLHIEEIFDTKGLHFALHLYEKGEYLTTAIKPLKDLLFIVKGELVIYGIHEDGSYFSVANERFGAMLGDMEYCGYTKEMMFTEAKQDVYCVALSIEENKDVLYKDLKFQNYLVKQLSERVHMSAKVQLSFSNLEEKVLWYLEEVAKNHSIESVNDCTVALHCERRQLQRVLKKLCDNGIIEKTGKGKYKLNDNYIL